MEQILINRLVDIKSKPVNTLPDSSSAPISLKTILGRLNLPDSKVMKEISTEIAAEWELGQIKADKKYDIEHVDQSTNYGFLNSGEKAILAEDSSLGYMFFPLDTLLFVRDKGKLVELRISEDPSEEELIKILKGKEILVNKHGIYESYRTIFTRIMFDLGS